MVIGTGRKNSYQVMRNFLTLFIAVFFATIAFFQGAPSGSYLIQALDSEGNTYSGFLIKK